MRIRSQAAKRWSVGLRLFVSILLSSVFLFQQTSFAYDALARKTPFYDPSILSCGSGGGSLSGSDNRAKIFNYLLGKMVNGKPLQNYHVAGIMGSMKVESGFEPQRLQSIYDRKVPADQVYPTSPASNPTVSKTGWGVVQWTPYTKVIDPLTSASKDPNDLQTQLDFLLEQLNGGTKSPEKGAGDAVIAATNVAEATVAFELKYERHAGDPQPQRVINAEEILNDASTGAIGTAVAGGDKPVIALDPGHGGTTINRIDPQTGLHDGDYNNDTERKQVFAVAQMAKQQLEQAGYQVVLTKDTAEQSVFLRDRANVGNNAHAALGVSIHTQGDKAFGTWQEIYVQKVGLYRGSGANKQTFTDSGLAQKSQEYARIMKGERDSIEVTSGTTVITDNSFDGRTGGIEPGNIPLVELWATVPWIYLEAGGNNLTSGLTDQQKATYANAIVSGVKKAIPSATLTDPSSCGGNTQGLANTITTYAWPDYRGSGYTTMKPEYAAAVATARTNHQYIGGVSFPGVDCGGFVTRAMVNSGYEPNYNYAAQLANGAGNTVAQLAWVRANWQLVGRGNTVSTADLKQGDVAFRVNSDGSNDGHTFMYAGEIPNFGSHIASASLDDRAPMAGAENPLASNIEWYRKK